MLYEIKYSKQANIDLAKLLEHEPKAFQKAVALIEELKDYEDK